MARDKKKKKNFIPRSISAKTFTGKGSTINLVGLKGSIELRRNDKFSLRTLCNSFFLSFFFSLPFFFLCKSQERNESRYIYIYIRIPLPRRDNSILFPEIIISPFKISISLRERVFLRCSNSRSSVQKIGEGGGKKYGEKTKGERSWLKGAGIFFMT